MKNIKLSIIFVTYTVLLICAINNSAYCQDQSDYYFRKASFPPYESEVKFKRIDYEIPYLTSLSLEAIAESLGITQITPFNNPRYLDNYVDFMAVDGSIGNTIMEYYIFTSREDAETYALDSVGFSSAWFTHSSDAGFDVEIGDNCWFVGTAKQWFEGEFPHSQALKFVRNNVYINLYLKNLPHKMGLLTFAKALDDYIIENSISDSSLDVKAPEILSHSVLSAEIDNGRYRYQLAVNAIDTTDQDSTPLYYRAINSNNSFDREGHVRCVALTDKAEVKVWVINKDHIVASKDIFDVHRGLR